MTEQKELTELVVIEKANALTTFTSEDEILKIVETIRSHVMPIVPNVSTQKGRDEIRSTAYKVAQAKTKLEKYGKDLSAEYKKIPAKIDAHKNLLVAQLDALQKEVRQPLTDWEAGEKLKEEEEAARKKAEELAKQIEADHEIALILNANFDLEQEKNKADEAKAKQEYEENLKREAARKAQQEAEDKIKLIEAETARLKMAHELSLKKLKKISDESCKD